MNTLKKIAGTTALVFFSTAALQGYADDAISLDDFVEEATSKGITIIENSRLALEKSGNTEVKAFASQLIDHHSKSNQKLAELAGSKNIDVADNATLLNRIKTTLLKARTEGSFDPSNAQNQVTVHEQTITLYQQAAHGSDADIKKFAEKSLPKLQDHLEEARKLAAKTEQQYRNSTEYQDITPSTNPHPSPAVPANR